MPRRQGQSAEPSISPSMPYDFSQVPNCIVSQEGLQGSVLEEVVCRVDWVSAVSELVGLSHEAADRRARKTGSFHGIHHDHAEAERLSFSFIAERAQTDDPIEGYMIRTKDRTRRLQGFLWFTNFTTWTHFFRFDSLASKAELHGRAQRDGISWDSDGSLSSELELQVRDGDPNDQGVIWPRVAEIALVGALECGGFLVQLALEALERSMDYDFVVVQATESSAGFYDRMGFKRVGALAKYITSDVAPHQARTVAYRHWAYPDEDVSKMDPSIMMAIKLRSGQVVQRIMPELGGIYPNRLRFMQKIPSRGVLSDNRQRFVTPSRVPLPGEGAVGAESRMLVDASPATDNVKEPARRSQACRPWVCYGNPSATCSSPKRNRETASNQLHSSSLLLQNARAASEVEPALHPIRVIKGPALCSPKRKIGNQEQFTPEPFGASAESDQNISVCSPDVDPSGQKQKRQRRGTVWSPDFVVSCVGRRYQSSSVQGAIRARKSQITPRRIMSPKQQLSRTLSARELRYKKSSSRAAGSSPTLCTHARRDTNKQRGGSDASRHSPDSALPKPTLILVPEGTNEAGNADGDNGHITSKPDRKLAGTGVHRAETIVMQCTCNTDTTAAEEVQLCSYCTRRKEAAARRGHRTSRGCGGSKKKGSTMSKSPRCEGSVVGGRLRRHRMPVTKFRFHRFGIQSVVASQKELESTSRARIRASCKASVRSWRQRKSSSQAERNRANIDGPSMSNAAHKVETSKVLERSEVWFPPYPFVNDEDGKICDLVHRPFRCPFTCIDGVIHATPGYAAVAPMLGNKILLQASDPQTKSSINKTDDSAAPHSPAEDDENDEFLWDKLSCEKCNRTDREDEMILCDSCDSGWHINCTSPPLQSIPEGEWFCKGCLAKKSRKLASESSMASSKADQCAENQSNASRIGAQRVRLPVSRFKFYRGGVSSGRVNSKLEPSLHGGGSVSSEDESCKAAVEGFCVPNQHIEAPKMEELPHDASCHKAQEEEKRSDHDCFWRDLKSETLRSVCQDLALRLEGNQSTLVEKIISKLGKPIPDGDDLKLLRMFTLRSICSDTALTVRGSKDEIRFRLVRFLSSAATSSVASADSCDECPDASPMPNSEQDVEDTEQVWQQWPCDGCGSSDREEEMILCDQCDAGWHLDCLTPPLCAIPDGDWFCPGCASRKRGRSSSAVGAVRKYGRAHRASRAGADGGVGSRAAAHGGASGEDPFGFDPGDAGGKRQRAPVARFKFSCVGVKA